LIEVEEHSQCPASTPLLLRRRRAESPTRKPSTAAVAALQAVHMSISPSELVPKRCGQPSNW